MDMTVFLQGPNGATGEKGEIVWYHFYTHISVFFIEKVNE